MEGGKLEAVPREHYRPLPVWHTVAGWCPLGLIPSAGPLNPRPWRTLSFYHVVWARLTAAVGTAELSLLCDWGAAAHRALPWTLRNAGPRQRRVWRVAQPVLLPQNLVGGLGALAAAEWQQGGCPLFCRWRLLANAHSQRGWHAMSG